ncbi:MAG: hypothetical protein ACI4GY_06970 [Acutalibacteraceae bacterium]
MNRNYLTVKKFNKKSFIATNEWKNRECGSFDYPNFIVYTENVMVDGFEKLCCVEDKIVFYSFVKQVRDFILCVAKENGDGIIGIGPYFNDHNYNDWSNMNQFDSFISLSSTIKNNEYALLNIEDDTNIIDLIIENNFRYLSYVNILLKNANMLVFPTHNMELIVFSNDISNAKNKWSKIIRNTEWKIFDDQKY